MPVLKPQDIVILLKLALLRREATSDFHQSGRLGLAPAAWSFAQIASTLKMSTQTVHAGLQTASQARLYDPKTKFPITNNLIEFLVHGVKYCFPPTRGSLTRGLPTSYAGSPLVFKLPPASGPPPVWPYPHGQVNGFAFEPLYKPVPYIALADPQLSELLVLVDAIRDSDARITSLAADELAQRLKS